MSVAWTVVLAVAAAAAPATQPAPPEPRCVWFPVDLALYPAVTLNDTRAGCERNIFGLALGASRAGELAGLQLAVGANGVVRNMGGLQLAALGNVVGRRGYGVQVAGLFNAAGEEMIGLQVAGLFNVAGKEMRGPQLAGLFNVAGERDAGLQVAGLLNVAGEEQRGLQVAGLLNVAGERAAGLQVAGLLNVTGQAMRGVQLCAGYNRVGADLAGAQIGLVNVGAEVRGVQLGLVNVARRVRGVQLGLVNVAGEADAPIGAVSMVRGGPRWVEAWGDDVLAAHAGVRLGGRWVTSLVGLAFDPLRDGTPWGPLAGAGVRIPVVPALEVLVDVVGQLVITFASGAGRTAAGCVPDCVYPDNGSGIVDDEVDVVSRAREQEPSRARDHACVVT